MNINENYINNTEEYERALSALLIPDGKRISEIAESKYNSVSKETLRNVSRYLVEEHVILIESDGKKSDPRIYRNNVMSLFQLMWKTYSIKDAKGFDERISELREDIRIYEKETGYDTPQELLKAIKTEDVDLSHIKTEDTGEIFWDVYIPWLNTINRIKIIEATRKLTDEIEIESNSIGMDVSGQYGDFSNPNAIRAKLGIENQPSDDTTINDNGELSDDYLV